VELAKKNLLRKRVNEAKSNFKREKGFFLTEISTDKTSVLSTHKKTAEHEAMALVILPLESFAMKPGR
jgi:hypothetical protein